jgi:hypothetical protein
MIEGMRWLLLVGVAACGFSTRVVPENGLDDGGPGEGIDAPDPDAPTPRRHPPIAAPSRSKRCPRRPACGATTARSGAGGGQATAIAAGSYHDCAIMMNGSVMCWGTNTHGQLGNNTTTSSATPVQAAVCP